MKSPFAKPLTVSLLNGQSMAVSPKGTDVPIDKWFQAATEVGCKPLGQTHSPAEVVAAQPQGKSDHEQLKDTLKAMIEKDDLNDFMPNGNPNLGRVQIAHGKSVSDDQLMTAWKELKAEAEQ